MSEYSKIRPRRGTSYEWGALDPVIEEGELVIEVPDSGIGTGLSKFKIGDSEGSKYSELPYAFDGSAAESINGGDPSSFKVIQVRSGTQTLWEQVNPILSENEIGYDTTNYLFKLGDGVSHWAELEYTSTKQFVEDVDWSGELDFGDEDTITSVGSYNQVDGSSIADATAAAAFDEVIDNSNLGLDVLD